MYFKHCCSCCRHFQVSLRSHKLIRATPEMFINKMYCNCFNSASSSNRFCNSVTFYSWKVHCCMMLRLAGPPTQDWGGQSNVTSFLSSVGMLEICPDPHHSGASHIPGLETDLVLPLVWNYTCYIWKYPDTPKYYLMCSRRVKTGFRERAAKLVLSLPIYKTVLQPYTTSLGVLNKVLYFNFSFERIGQISVPKCSWLISSWAGSIWKLKMISTNSPDCSPLAQK